VPWWYNEGQSVVRVLAILTIYIVTSSLFRSYFAVGPVNSIWFIQLLMVEDFQGVCVGFAGREVGIEIIQVLKR